MRVLALAAIAAAAIIAVALLGHGVPREADEIAGTALVLALLAAPPVVLLVFHGMLRALLALPERLRAVPRQGRDNVATFATVASAARTARWYQLPVHLWRLRALAGASRDVLTPYAAVTALLNVPFLVAVAVAAAAALIEIAAAVVVLLALAV